MSGNINDTNVTKLRNLVCEFIEELDEVIKNGESTSDYEHIYKKKYQYILKTSPTLFNLICEQYKSTNFNKTHLLNNLNMMLQAIEKIQGSKITQHDASTSIGEVLAKQYIPQLKK
jgi:hypothetical protein